MKSASAGLISLLGSGQSFLMADLYTFSLVNGATLRYTSAETSLTVGGNVFDGGTLLIDRGKTRTIVGVEVDTLDLTVTADISHLVAGAPFLQAIRNGALDGATVQLERCFMPTWGDTSLGTVILFAGTVADIDVGRTAATVRCNSHLQVLNIKMPRNLYQPGCLNTLFDAKCALTKASWSTAGTIQAGSSASVLLVSVTATPAAGYFDMGSITFTSGVLNGISASIKQYTPGTLALFVPLISTPAAGDTFNAYAGCDKSQATCTTKFSNLANFRGFPYVPTPDTVTG